MIPAFKNALVATNTPKEMPRKRLTEKFDAEAWEALAPKEIQVRKPRLTTEGEVVWVS